MSYVKTVGLSCALMALCGLQGVSAQSYPTRGVHNTTGCNVSNHFCIAERQRGEPSDPFFPAWWVSDWTMFRVKTNYEKNPPPYSNPPSTLKPEDYTVSEGTTYYDTTYIPADGDGYGAMMEHYKKYCLPIFPIKDNNYSCSFISLGNKAYFLTYDDRPKDMPPCCLFSPDNHPPRQNFIQHLPYDKKRSAHLDHSTQAYSITLNSPSGPILFGYAFLAKAQADPGGGPLYRHPQSFYFSGNKDLANAPIVSQNYTNFHIERPDPAKTWDWVGKMCPANPPPCQLFNQPKDNVSYPASWNKLGEQVK